ncbi:hypothetical protein OG413_20630 [Streptomyces sp. NBC_01433]|uniref:hypothetical protein n=1 Tax=Streptomyces sp. NBC_01433 TaxID=2903864 RepID=UPI002253F938|nr:hypothetical protein [Streptomyces sp. NBC_01433]MCX4677681.1 hypothetical protein [Streptomyces sp. NBC_01433]
MAQTALFTLPTPPAPAPVPVRVGKRPTVLSYGLGADSTAILLKFLADPEAYGLEPDLSDLIVVHAVTGDEWPDSLSYVRRLVLPLLAARKVRTVQLSRGGRRDSDGVLILDDTRTPGHIWEAGPWRLSEELCAAGTVPQMASGRRTCSIRFKGWVLDAWAFYEFGASSFRRVIGYHAGERDRAEKDTQIQERINAEAGRVVYEPYYPLIDTDGMDRAAVETYVHARLGERIRKSYCAQCPFSLTCAARDRHEERLRDHPAIGSAVLMMEYTSQALNEKVALYGERSLYQQLTEDARNDEVLTRFEEALDAVPFALYEVRRLYLPGRTKDCRNQHGKRCSSPRWWCRTKPTTVCRRRHRGGGHAPECGGSDPACRGEQAKGQAWRSVRTVWEGSRFDAGVTLLRWGREAGARLRTGESMIRRVHYLEAGEGYPSADAYLVAAPVGVEDKQRTAKRPDAGFEAKWTQVTGLAGTRWEPVRPLVVRQQDRTVGPVPVRSLGKAQRALAVELSA